MADQHYSDALLERQFTYHAPTTGQFERMERIRKAGHAFSAVIRDNTIQCPDQDASIRKVREAEMTANAAVVLEPQE